MKEKNKKRGGGEGSRTRGRRKLGWREWWLLPNPTRLANNKIALNNVLMSLLLALMAWRWHLGDDWWGHCDATLGSFKHTQIMTIKPVTSFSCAVTAFFIKFLPFLFLPSLFYSSLCVLPLLFILILLVSLFPSFTPYIHSFAVIPLSFLVLLLASHYPTYFNSLHYYFSFATFFPSVIPYICFYYLFAFIPFSFQSSFTSCFFIRPSSLLVIPSLPSFPCLPSTSHSWHSLQHTLPSPFSSFASSFVSIPFLAPYVTPHFAFFHSIF